MSPSNPSYKSSTSAQAELVPSIFCYSCISFTISTSNSVIDTTPPLLIVYLSLLHLPHPSPLFHHPLILIGMHGCRETSKSPLKEEKGITKKMKGSNSRTGKMNPHVDLKKPASDESTSDEEEMIVYDVEDEIESDPDYVKESNGKTYYKGQLRCSNEKHRK
ncbi:hypothetical protein TNCV_3224531 [Trichonephila clavipes]|nr:hypothetical protein TNCV_3224531 [Trichonephila clavipes]